MEIPFAIADVDKIPVGSQLYINSKSTSSILVGVGEIAQADYKWLTALPSLGT